MRFLYRCLLPLGFIVFFGSCSVQDHVNPNEPASCRMSLRLSALASLLLPPGQTVAVGEQALSDVSGYFEVREIIQVDGRSYAVGWKSDVYRIGAEDSNTSYEYDAQGRVKKTVQHLKRPSWDITTEYEYFPTEVKLTVTDDRHIYPVPPVYTKILPLNAQGYVIDTNVTYNAEGYVIRRGPITYEIENGNVVKGEGLRYEYDLSRPNPVPDPITIYGRPNRNLRTRAYPDPANPPAEYGHHYIYYPNGRLKYEIFTSKYPDQERVGIQINGYEWACTQ
ncbi:hypothetical protein [Larkinella soli]|uniref:hypothetical protein n=1 Tax=Larkinella soli TaxID=1770527 RepID=UPI000FFB47F4|nr:hypothetical protein [Larkinella soli]